MTKRILLLFLLLASLPAIAQRSNIVYVDQFPGKTTADKIGNAEATCNPAYWCKVVIDGSLPSNGVDPAPCAKCFREDWRTTSTAPISGATSAPVDSYFYASPSFRLSQIGRATNSMLANGNWGIGGAVGSPVRVAVIGDSIWSYYTQSFRTAAASYGQLNAIGFTQFYGNIWGDDFSTFTVPGGCVGTRNDTASADAWGVSGTRVDCTGSQTITIQPNTKFPFANYRIWYSKAPGRGTFTYALDGGAASAPVDTSAGSASLGFVTVTGVGLSAHSLVIATTGAVRLYGVDMWNDKGGFVFDVLQSGGSNAYQWNGRSDYTGQYLAATSPALLDIELGVNDFAGGRSCSNVMSDVDSLVTQLSLPSTTPVVRETWWWRGNPPGTEDTAFRNTVSACRSTMLANARQQDYSVFDIQSFWPSYSVAWSKGLYYAADVIHPSAAGAYYKYSALAKALFGQVASDSNFWGIWGGQLTGDASGIYHNSSASSAVLDRWGGSIPGSVYCRATNDTGNPSTRSLLQCLNASGTVTIQLDGSTNGTIAVGTNTSIVSGGMFLNADSKARISGNTNGAIDINYNTGGTANLNHNCGTASPCFVINGSTGKVTASGGVAVESTGNVSITAGTGAPSAGACTASTLGALYLNKSGGASTTLYVCTAAGTWTAK